jgi:branched-chain amino acid transport system permease protein
MDLALNLLANILIPGSIFALITVGFSLIYSVTRILHIAHGGVMLAAGYAFYAGYSLLEMPTWAAVLMALITAVILGGFINSVIYEKFRDKKSVSAAGSLIATISLLLIIQNVLLAMFGSATKSFSELQGSIHKIGPVLVTEHEIRTIIISAVILVLLSIYLIKSRVGKALRAVAENETVAEVVGISSYRMRSTAFIIGSLMAGIAGILFAIEYNLEPTMSTMIAVRMFFRAIVGGVGSVAGAILGTMILETGAALTGWYWNVAWIDLVGFAITFIILLFLPNGLLSKRKRKV